MIKNLFNFFHLKRAKFYKEYFPEVYNKKDFEKRYQYLFALKYLEPNRVVFSMSIYSKIHDVNYYHSKYLDFTLVQTPFYMLSLINSFLSVKSSSSPIFRVNVINTSNRTIPIILINSDYVKSFFNKDVIEFLSNNSRNDVLYSRVILNVLIEDEWFEKL